jgi:MHS family shikimate/dehydroshikimate transporter-like MFS transporter
LGAQAIDGRFDRAEPGHRKSIRRVAFASFIGTAVEWYDFFAYGTAAALVFPKLFFPRFDPLAGTLASFATFGVGFIARPVGGAVFGHLGDRIGRKSMLVATLLLMGGATFLIGLLPTFEQIGVLAPILLVTLRFVQGFAVGGEWGGATLMAFEHAPEQDRNFYASWPQLGVPAGLVASTGVFAAFSVLPETQFFAWGWRMAFLLSIALIVVGVVIRLRVAESPVFRRVKERGAESKAPLLEVLRDHRLALVLAIGVVLVSITGFYIATTFSLAYLTKQLGVSRSVALVGIVLLSVSEAVSILIFARLADLVGRHRVAICSAICIMLFSYPFFWLLTTRVPALIWLAMCLQGFIASALYGITGAILAELFVPSVRCSGISLGYQMAGILGGAPAPIIATYLVHWSGGATWSVATYLAASSVITFAAVYAVSRRKGAAMA